MKKKDKNLGEFEAICEDISYDGKGVTHYQGKVVFVSGFSGKITSSCELFLFS